MEHDHQHHIHYAQPGADKMGALIKLVFLLVVFAVFYYFVVLPAPGRATDLELQFMGLFFSLVAILKLADWPGFAAAYAEYDLLASRSRVYAYVYPLLELAQGLFYLANWQVRSVAFLTLILMVIGVIGVARNLLSKNPVRCACLGTIIPIPLTKFTLAEDIIMGLMALLIIFNG